MPAEHQPEHWRLSAKEHASIWRLAARVVGAMDPRWDHSAVGQMIMQMSKDDQTAIWNAYMSAASVLNQIAKEYEEASNRPGGGG